METLSIVSPCYNEEEAIPNFLERTISAAETTDRSYEIILIDDGSTDATWRLIQQAANTYNSVHGIRLLRNHGHQLALSAGLAATKGDLVVAIDADLQDPPELIPDMISVMQREHADVVYAQRRKRAGETWFKLLTAHIFYRVLRSLTKVDIPPDTGDFRLMRRELVDVLNSMPERHRFIRGMVSWIGGRQVPYQYDRDARFAGETKYPLKKMLLFAFDAITSFSRQPLVFATYLGVIMGVISILLAFWSLLSYFIFDTVAGWSSLITIITLQFALVFFSIGMIGEYIGRIFELGQGRPLYIVREIAGDGLQDTGSNSLSRPDAALSKNLKAPNSTAE